MGASDASMFLLHQVGNLADTTEAGLEQTLSVIASCLGFPYFHFSHRVSGASCAVAPVQVTTYPEEWKRRYDQMRYAEVDPILAHCMRSTAPITWNDDLITPESTRMWEEAAAYGLRYGLSLAVHERAGALSILSLAREMPLRRVELGWVTCTARAVLATVHFAVVESTRRSSGQAEGSLLTPREAQVIELASAGLSSREIGARLNISTRTVTFHLQGVMRKLGCRNRAAAISQVATIGFPSNTAGAPSRAGLADSLM